MTVQVPVKGYVVGYDLVTTLRGQELLWTVKVKDVTSEYDGRKFLVASLHPGTMLTQPGKSVSFRIAPVEVGQELVLRAVDVAIGAAEGSEPTNEPTLTMNVCAVRRSIDGQIEVFINTGLQTLEQARLQFDSRDRTVVGFRNINCEPADQPEEVKNGLRILHGLSCLDGTLQAQNYVFKQVFALGHEVAQREV